MKAKEFPRLKEYEAPERTMEREKDLPLALRKGLNYFLARQIIGLEDFERVYGSSEDTKEQIKEIRRLDREKVYGKLKKGLEKHQPLEVIALFDLITQFLDQELRTLYTVPPEKYPVNWEAEETRLSNLKENYAYHRDRLLEEIPELRETCRREDFEKWLRESLVSHEELLKITSKKEENKGFLENVASAYRTLDNALSGRLLGREELRKLVELLDNEIRMYREPTRDLLVEWLLGKPYDGEELKNQEKMILMFRQFKVGVESGEWVKTRAAV